MVESISKQPWFHGLLPREEVKILLTKNGDFLVRMSEPSAGQSRHLILSMMQCQDDPNHEGMHYVIRAVEGKFSITEKDSFNSLNELIDHHKINRINESMPTSVLVCPITRQPWELNHEDVTMTKTLGEGAFGEVKCGTLRLPGGDKVDVAVKVAKLEKCTKEQIKEITTEARLMRRFDHRNVVRCFGVAAVEEPLLVVMELVQGGGLDGYLSKNSVNMNEKLDIILQVASGLAYIHKNNIMHRDIAARNVLYGNGTAKVSDFGLSRLGTSYQMDPNKKVPIRWLSPETLTTFVYTQLTDVFSFGVLCWEVIENGATPYPGLLVAEVHQKVIKEDYRMSISDKAPDQLRDVIKKCWLRETSERPSMEKVHQMVAKFVDKKEEAHTQTTTTPAQPPSPAPVVTPSKKNKEKNRFIPSIGKPSVSNLANPNSKCEKAKGRNGLLKKKPSSLGAGGNSGGSVTRSVADKKKDKDKKKKKKKD